ncbi:MAG: DUF3996 domain-containing protein [Ignavibacteriae bacterium]|nr:MAG: DUF3996 domain-containing protein [Ignavibacteriota bacterium]
MKFLSYAIFTICLFIAFQTTFAQERKFGLGFMIGEPTGISAKLWTTNNNAFDFGLGWTAFNNRYNSGSYVHFHMDYLWHSFDALNATERIPLYYGIGGRINTRAGNESSFAVRGVFGVAWMPRSTPIDIFLELAPSLELTPSSGFALDAAVGIRYFF